MHILGGGDMSIAIVVIFQVKSGKESQFEAELDRVLKVSAGAEGFVRCERYRQAGDAGRYLLHEIWANGDLLDAQVKSDHFRNFVEATDSLLDAKDVHVLEPF
jgi:quinol monooxygenase YgiN